MTKPSHLTDAEAAVQGLVPWYNGYYRESAKHRTEWFCLASGYNRKLVNRKLKYQIESDRASGFYGSRIKIVKIHVKPE